MLFEGQHTLTCFVCSEVFDTVEDIKACAEVIENHFDAVSARYPTIVLVPFGHLSEMAESNLDMVAKRLQKLENVLLHKGLRVSSVKTDSGNVLFAKWLMFDHGSSVRFRSTRNGLRMALSELIHVFGIERVFAELAKILRKKEG